MAPRCSPVARVLTEPCLILGVEKPFAIVNFTLMMVLAGELHLVACLPVGLLTHLILRRITRADPFTRLIYARYARQCNAYDPWIQPRLAGAGRGFARHREVLC